MKEGKFRLDIGKNFFIVKMARHWSRKVVDSPTLAVIQARLDEVLSSLV